MMEDKKDILLGEYRKSPVFAGYLTKKTIQLYPLQIYLETLSIYIHLKIEAEEFVA